MIDYHQSSPRSLSLAAAHASRVTRLSEAARPRRVTAAGRGAKAPGRGRCVSMFLDKNRRCIGKSQSKTSRQILGRYGRRTGSGRLPAMSGAGRQPRRRLLLPLLLRRHERRRLRLGLGLGALPAVGNPAEDVAPDLQRQVRRG
jgi:hypothetical protein